MARSPRASGTCASTTAPCGSSRTSGPWAHRHRPRCMAARSCRPWSSRTSTSPAGRRSSRREAGMDYPELARGALEAALADHVEVLVEGYDEAVTRFSGNAISQNVAKSVVECTLRVAFGQKVGQATTTDLTPEGVAAALRRAEDIARSSAPDPEYLPPPGPQEHPEVDAHDPATGELGPSERAAAVALTAGLSQEAGVDSSGSYTSGQRRVFLANSSGLTTSQARSFAKFTVSTSAETGGSGWAEGVSHRAADLDVEALARRAIGKATTGGEPVAATPGPTTVVLEPAAFAGLMGFVAWTLDAKEADEGRSPWSGKVGDKFGLDSLNMRSDPLDPRLAGDPMTEDGLAARRVEWIESGVLKQLAYSRFWAKEKGVEPTGFCENLVVDGGQGADSDLVSQVEDGVLVTRFWYMNFVDEMALSITGMTRGGLFRIQGGEVTGALTNLRFNDTPFGFLKRVRAMGAPVLTNTEFDEAMVCPPVVIDDFHFTSGTSF
ncbi:MAG: hypothetical protein GF320_02680 [Armatimonadia bacterium]|nr:hypothetical protein [Armatimonadia bacterium]